MNYKDSQELKEVLSALADGEVSGRDEIAEAEMIELACRDQDAMSAWQCMHLARDVLQADYQGALSSDFAAKVSERVALEEQFSSANLGGGVVSSSVVSMTDARDRIASRRSAAKDKTTVNTQQQPFTLWKPVAGLGLAASLAGATFLFAQLWQTEQTDASLVAQTQSETEQESSLMLAAQQNAADDNDSVLQVAIGSSSTSSTGTRWRTDGEASRNKEIEQRLNTLLTNHLEDASMGRVQGIVSHSRVVGYDSVPADK